MTDEHIPSSSRDTESSAASSQTRALQIIRLLASIDGGCTISEVTERLTISRTTTFRTLENLVDEGWVTTSGRPRKYSAAMRVTALGLSVVRYRRLRESLFPFVLQLAEATNTYSSLGLYEAGFLLITDAAEPIGGKLVMHVGGTEIPATCTSGGKIILAHRSDDEINKVCALPCPRFTDQTRCLPAEMRADIERTRELGYGLTDREFLADASGVSFAVFDAGGEAVAALGLTFIGPLDAQPVQHVVGTGLSVASEASHALGFRRRRSRVLVS